MTLGNGGHVTSTYSEAIQVVLVEWDAKPFLMGGGGLSCVIS